MNDNTENTPVVDLPRHMATLDELRDVAILLVLLVHCGQDWPGALQVFQNSLDMPFTFIEPAWSQNITNGGGSGVQPFFVVCAFTSWFRPIASSASWTRF